MSRRVAYAEDYDPVVLGEMKKNSFDEETAFRTQMKGLEEYATSGAVTKPGANIAGMRVKLAHRMGDRFDVMVQDPFTRQARTVVSHQYDLTGRRVRTDVAWTPGDPRSVAAAFGVPFVSAFGDLPDSKPPEAVVKDEVRKTRQNVIRRAMVRRAEEETEMELERQAFLRVRGKTRGQVAPSDWDRSERYKKRRGIK